MGGCFDIVILIDRSDGFFELGVSRPCLDRPVVSGDLPWNGLAAFDGIAAGNPGLEPRDCFQSGAGYPGWNHPSLFRQLVLGIGSGDPG